MTKRVGLNIKYPVVERLSDRDRAKTKRPSFHVSAFIDGMWTGVETTFDFEKAMKTARGYKKARVTEHTR